MTLSDLFSWVQMLLTQLGIWPILSVSLQAMLIITVSMAIIRSLRSGG